MMQCLFTDMYSGSLKTAVMQRKDPRYVLR
jgi:hypothetical protein